MITQVKYLLIVITLSTFIFLGGCAKFSSSRHLDMRSFGENTSAMINEIKAGLTIKRSLLTTPFIHGEAVIQFRKHKEDIGIILRGIIFYSTQIVNISRANLTDEEKAKKLGEYIKRLATPVVEAKDPDIRISTEKLDAIVAKINNQQTFLDALGAAQPLVDALNGFMTNSLETMKGLAEQIAEETSVRIDQHSAAVITNKNNLEAFQTQTMQSFHLLNSLRAGKAGAMDELLQNDPALKEYVKPGTTVGKQDMDLMETALMRRFENTQALLDSLKPRIDEYHAQIREMEELMYSFEQSARRLQLSVTLWARSHANLAAGIEVPPEIDIGKMITGTASNVVDKVIP